MKKLFLFASAVILSAGVFAQAKKTEDVIKFKEMSYDFGKIKQNDPVKHDFVFTNISNSPVIIEAAVASCGCTTSFKPEGAIPQGKSDKITASFDARTAGTFTKTITVKAAGTDAPTQIKITGEVLTPDAYAKYEAAKSGSGR